MKNYLIIYTHTNGRAVKMKVQCANYDRAVAIAERYLVAGETYEIKER